MQPKVTLAELDALQEQLREVDGASDMGSFTDQFVAGQLLRVLCSLVEQARMLVQKYDVVVTNPPYMGGSGMNARLSDYVKKVYPDSKSDLFAVFIRALRPNGQARRVSGYDYPARMDVPFQL